MRAHSIRERLIPEVRRRCYRMSFLGHREGGKTAFLAALGMQAESRDGDAVTCADALPNVPAPPGDHAAWDLARDPVAAFYLGAVLLRRARDAMRRGEPGHYTPENVPLLSLFHFSSRARGKFSVEMMDYAGELIGVEKTNSALTIGLRRHLAEMDAILIAVEVGAGEPTAEQIATLNELSQAFHNARTDGTPVGLVLTKWDLRGKKGATPAEREQELEVFLGVEGSPYAKLRAEIVAKVGMDNFKAFAASAYGEARNAAPTDQKPRWVPANPLRLGSYGMIEPFLWAANRRDALDLKHLGQTRPPDTWYSVLNLFDPRTPFLHAANAERLSHRLPKDAPSSEKLAQERRLGQRLGWSRRVSLAAAATLLFAGGWFGWQWYEQRQETRSFHQATLARGQESVEAWERHLKQFPNGLMRIQAEVNHATAVGAVREAENADAMLRLKEKTTTMLADDGAPLEAIEELLKEAQGQPPHRNHLNLGIVTRKAEICEQIAGRIEKRKQAAWDEGLAADRRHLAIIEERLKKPVIEQDLQEMEALLRNLPFAAGLRDPKLRKMAEGLGGAIADKKIQLAVAGDWARFEREFDRALAAGNIGEAAKLLKQRKPPKEFENAFPAKAAAAMDRWERGLRDGRRFADLVRSLRKAAEDVGALAGMDDVKRDLAQRLRKTRADYGKHLYDLARENKDSPEAGLRLYESEDCDQRMRGDIKKWSEYRELRNMKRDCGIRVTSVEWGDWWHNYQNVVEISVGGNEVARDEGVKSIKNQVSENVAAGSFKAAPSETIRIRVYVTNQVGRHSGLYTRPGGQTPEISLRAEDLRDGIKYELEPYNDRPTHGAKVTVQIFGLPEVVELPPWAE